jgi:hypothetical protein
LKIKKKRKMEKKMGGERRRMTNREMADEDTGGGDVEGKLAMGEGKPLYSGQICGSLD